jgi:DNA polymerase-3 subunit delta
MTKMAEKRDASAARAYLLKGDDEFQKRRALDELLKSLVAEEFADFDLEEIEAASATCDRVIAGLNVPPFGSGRRVVLVRFANKMNSDEQEKLAARLEKAPRSGCLVVVNPAVERSDGKPKKGSEVVGELSKAIRKVGQVREFGPPKGRDAAEELGKFARTRFAAAGKKITSEALALFVQRTGNDLSIISTEAEKLIDYSGDEPEITRADVEAVTSETPEEKVFKMVDAVAARNAGAALRFLDELFETGDDPRADAPRALSMIARQFRLIWQAKMLAEAGVKRFEKSAVPEELKAGLPSSPNLLEIASWQAGRAANQAGRFSHADLARCFLAVAKADAMLKGVEGEIEDPRMVMELLVIELAGGRQR